jgi:hypothetical protein
MMPNDEVAMLREALRVQIQLTGNLLDHLATSGAMTRFEAWGIASEPKNWVKDPELLAAWNKVEERLR